MMMLQPYCGMAKQTETLHTESANPRAWDDSPAHGKPGPRCALGEYVSN